MKEEIELIADGIRKHRSLELAINASNIAFSRVATHFQNEKTIFWITNQENKAGVQFIPNMSGSITQTQAGNRTTITEDGRVVYKNTKIGEILILNHEGQHKYKTPGGEAEVEILNRAIYNPSDNSEEYATDISIKIAGDGRTHTFQNISKILSLHIEIEKEKEKLESATNEEALQLLQRIANKEAEMKNYLSKAQGFIRKYAELRYQPILDPIQESIKRSKIFEGSLIINGGPGTGKTTSLIQRIKFLISPSIEEYIKLSQSQKDILFNQSTSWVFYSPNELLALFLRNSMKMEGLTADTERVKVWSSHKNELVKAYKLVDTTTKRPFLIYNKSQGKNLFLNKSKNIQNISSGLEKYYIDFQKDKINKILEIDVATFRWKNTGMSIQRFLEDKKNIKSIDDLIRLFLNLNETYKSESDKIAEEYSLLIKQVVGRIQVLVTKNTERSTTLYDFLNQWKDNIQDIDDVDDDDAEIELEDFEEKEEQSSFDFERDLFTKLKSICRKQALKKFDRNTKFSKRDRELMTLIPEVEQQPEYEQIGQTAFFKKFFENITKGIVINILREIPMIYKKYRREQLTSNNNGWNLQILQELVSKDKNSRIHSDEQALLLYFTNSICFNLSKGFQRQFNNISHSYVNAYKNHSKPVIGIDEATDFSIIDLLSINSFKHPELSSITLSGDIMQRITTEGLTSWEDYSSIVPQTERKDLEVSYRQSPTLLSLAQSIYLKSTGKEAKYRSYIEKDESEPKPLIYVSHDDDEKLNWIAERIIEIYHVYKKHGDSIPAIAIFLPNENQLDVFSNKLGNIDTLSDVGIIVRACRNGDVLGDKNTVRVFSIDKIKGLEFEAVFFHNIDELQVQNLSNDLLLKYLYVGLSRATFYLGLTLSEELNNDLNFISKNFDKTGKTWLLK